MIGQVFVGWVQQAAQSRQVIQCTEPWMLTKRASDWLPIAVAGVAGSLPTIEIPIVVGPFPSDEPEAEDAS